MIEIALGEELKAYCQTSADEYNNIPYDSWRELDQKAQLPGKFFIKDRGNGYADIWYDPIISSCYEGYFEDPAYNPFRKFLADKYFNKDEREEKKTLPIPINLDAIMTAFSRAVDNKQYNRLAYDAWSNLFQIARTYNDVFVRFVSNSDGLVCVNLTYCGGQRKHWLTTDEYAPFRQFLIDNYYNKKESNEMNIMPNVNFDFGPAGDGIRVSPFGLAITNSKGQWITYDAKNDKIVDVTGFTFDFGKMIYKMPVAVKDIKPGDLIVHQSRAMYVQEIEDGNIYTVDILAAEKKNVLPVTNVFNFNFVTKVVSLMNFDMGTPSPDQPFGNIMPIMMMSALMGDDKNDFFGQMDMGKMMLMSAMMGGQNPLTNMFNGLTGIVQNPTA